MAQVTDSARRSGTFEALRCQWCLMTPHHRIAYIAGGVRGYPRPRAQGCLAGMARRSTANLIDGRGHRCSGKRWA
ncbi:hypothetical protein GOBAR_DD24348 [Gossypium barbadense]|nr:hypothetical protein GOBAR_DD24348 [Gossypium barbadense]